MTFLLGMTSLLVHVVLVLTLAPIVVGFIRWLKARLMGRVGPPVMQPWHDLVRLARKQPVLAENASWLFGAAPATVFAVTLAAAALVPGFALGMASAPLADLLVLVGLLALARCTLALAGLETGTAFGGIGACRTMTFATVAEPAMLLVIFALGLLAGTTNLDAIATMVREGSLGPLLSLGFALVAIVLVALAEGGRAPIDNAATRAEPAMVREAMVLEYSARHLALLEWAAALKLLLWLSLIATIFVPFGMATPQAGPLVWLLAPAVWALKVAALATVLALFESAITGMRVLRVPELLGVAVLLGLLAVVFLFVSQGFV